ncbi:hypothetical protein [Mycobacterium colombiense]|uniref:hypothetical protein n=1 Tax=Mycobacterium colombiense TaxID=339268 RepID=UPI00197B3670|nr:hypothetical protein [Mycobacterium colombiense]
MRTIRSVVKAAPYDGNKSQEKGRHDRKNRRQGYLRGLQYLGWLALPALALLVVGAVYEAFSLRYFVHPLAEWLL